MKMSFCLLACFAALTTAPIKGAELNPGAAKIENKLREIDLRLRLEQYEKVQKQLIEIRFQIAMLNAEDMPDEERKRQSARLSKMEEVLSVTLHQMLLQIRELAARDVAGK
jgi:hypothetical protein